MKSANLITKNKMERFTLAADLLVGESLAYSGPKNKLQAYMASLSAKVDNILTGLETSLSELKTNIQKKLDVDLPSGKNSRRPFHWLLEFPEVFMTGGFDAICGNPPFSGGQHLTGSLGIAYRNYLVEYIANGVKGSADLVAYFYLKCFRLIRVKGVFGLIACNTIAEGDTRQVGLERILQNGGIIFAAYPDMIWPGTASVVVSPVFITKNNNWLGNYILNNQSVKTISAFLSDQDEWSPQKLTQNENQSFIGSYVLGLGFTLSEEEAKQLLIINPKYKKALYPYLNGEDLNSNVNQIPSRWIINFWDWPLSRSLDINWSSTSESQRKQFFIEGNVPFDYPGDVVTDYPELFKLIEQKVKPERQRRKENGNYVLRSPMPQRWWQYGEKRPALYHEIGLGSIFAKHPKGWKDSSNMDNTLVLGTTLTSKHRFFYPLPRNITIDQTIVVISRPNSEWILNSNIHLIWAMKQGCTLGTGPRYTPSDSFETFPFPVCFSDELNSIGENFSKLRQEVMTEENIGLTRFYNLFHSPIIHNKKILNLRDLQKQIDKSVLNLYGWSDIDLNHNLYKVDYLSSSDNVRFTICEEARLEILKRLSVLNKERWEEEQKNK